MRYLLGIDQGTTQTMAVIVDEFGGLVLYWVTVPLVEAGWSKGASFWPSECSSEGRTRSSPQKSTFTQSSIEPRGLRIVDCGLAGAGIFHRKQRFFY